MNSQEASGWFLDWHLQETPKKVMEVAKIPVLTLLLLVKIHLEWEPFLQMGM